MSDLRCQLRYRTMGHNLEPGPTLKVPCKILPPATPPFNSSTLAPGLLTSKDRMTTIRGVAEKSYVGGSRLARASTTASMLNFNWAETGMIGARPAVVPKNSSASPHLEGHTPVARTIVDSPMTNFLIDSQCSTASDSRTRSILF